MVIGEDRTITNILVYQTKINPTHLHLHRLYKYLCTTNNKKAAEAAFSISNASILPAAPLRQLMWNNSRGNPPYAL